MGATSKHMITTLEELEALYGTPHAPALKKEVPTIIPSYRAIIEASPFAVLATVAGDGMDVSPRGDGPGFVKVQDDRTLLLPDRPGNRRIDSMRNILADPRVALIFLVPGVAETMRVNGTAEITTDPEILEPLSAKGKLPISALVIHVEAVFVQCAKAIMRSRLWNPELHAKREDLPTLGRMIEEASAGAEGGEEYDRMLPDRYKATMY